MCLDIGRLVRPWHKWETEELCFHLALPLHCHHGTQLRHGQQSSGYQLLAHIRVIIPASVSQGQHHHVCQKNLACGIGQNNSNIRSNGLCSMPQLHLVLKERGINFCTFLHWFCIYNVQIPLQIVRPL